ncbi:MAG: hypothetical protein Q8L29_04190 [archaeon]|nr:hypothetical protein [archaeon]
MEIQKDIGAEVIQRLKEINEWIIKAKEKLVEKDKKVIELENKLKEYNKEKN